MFEKIKRDFDTQEMVWMIFWAPKLLVGSIASLTNLGKSLKDAYSWVNSDLDSYSNPSEVSTATLEIPFCIHGASGRSFIGF